jgi:hypothetical protein
MKNRRRYHVKNYGGSKYFGPPLVRGLKQVHIGNDIWLIGKERTKDGQSHQVIYGPGNKEYHLYGKDVEFVNIREPDSYNRSLPYANHARVKIYILTHILDKKENWCFDLTKLPAIGSKVKTVCDNGTVKWIDSFNGKFEPIELKGKAYKYDPDRHYTIQKYIKPFAYRIDKIDAIYAEAKDRFDSTLKKLSE